MGRISSKIQKTDGLINTRFPVKVQEGKSGVPQALLLSGRWERVTSVVKQWDVSEILSGEKRLIKSYFEIFTESGTPLKLFRNQVTGSWYREDPAPNTWKLKRDSFIDPT